MTTASRSRSAARRDAGCWCFPAKPARACDFENIGMADGIRPLVEEGRVSLYCVDSLDGYTWSDRSASIEERAHRHGLDNQWLVEEALPFIARDNDGVQQLNGDHLRWLRDQVSVLLVCGQGAWRPTPLVRYRRHVRRPVCSRRRGFAVSSTSGGRTSAMTGRGGAASSPTTFRGSAEGPS